MHDPQTHYAIDISNNYQLIDAVYSFMSLHPTFYNIGTHKKIITHKNTTYDVFALPVHFTDTVHDVSGFLTTDFKDDQFMMTVNVPTDKFNHRCYVKVIKKYITHYSEHGNVVTLNYHKILPKRIVSYNFYKEPLDKWPSDVKELKSTFFSPHKNYLFDVTRPNDGHFKHAWNNIILHGPPGTGKSSFVHRMAIQRKMTIISLNLKLYLDKKTELYALFHGEPFALPDSPTKYDINKNYIIILDEFDTAVDTLLSIEKIHECKKGITSDYFKTQNAAVNKMAALRDVQPDGAADTSDDDDDTPAEDIMPGGKFNPQAFMMSQLQDEKRKVRSDPRQALAATTEKKMQFDTNINIINSNINTLIKSINEENRSDMLRLSDLLELFQGAVPVKKRMIIATTNNFDRMKKVIPALFRPGRLTPLKFDYAPWSSFTDLCRHHYQVEPKGLFFPIKIPTSQLIELVAKHPDCESYVQEVREMCIGKDKRQV